MEDSERNNKAAIIYYREALRVCPTAKVHLRMANLLKLRKDTFDKAEEHYQEAIKINPNFASTYIHFACFMRDKRRNYDRTEQYFKQALRLQPKNFDCLYELGTLLLRKLYDYEQARIYLQQAQRVQSDHMGVQQSLEEIEQFLVVYNETDLYLESSIGDLDEMDVDYSDDEDDVVFYSSTEDEGGFYEDYDEIDDDD